MGIEREFLPIANNHAIKARQSMGLEPDAPLCPFEYTIFRGYQVLKLTELLKDDPKRVKIQSNTENRKPVFSAGTLLSPYQKTILGFVVNDTHQLERQKSNLAHEWGHLFQGHIPQNILCNRKDIHSKREEQEADNVGFALLMTDQMCFRLAGEGLSDIEISEKYKISLPVVKLRMNRTYARKLIAA